MDMNQRPSIFIAIHTSKYLSPLTLRNKHCQIYIRDNNQADQSECRNRSISHFPILGQEHHILRKRWKYPNPKLNIELFFFRLRLKVCKNEDWAR